MRDVNFGILNLISHYIKSNTLVFSFTNNIEILNFIYQSI